MRTPIGESIARAIECRLQGLSSYQAAHRMGCSHSWVQWLWAEAKRRGLLPRGRHTIERMHLDSTLTDQIPRIVDALQGGATAKSLARQLGLQNQTLTEWLDRHGVEWRSGRKIIGRVPDWFESVVDSYQRKCAVEHLRKAGFSQDQAEFLVEEHGVL